MKKMSLSQFVYQSMNDANKISVKRKCEKWAKEFGTNLTESEYLSCFKDIFLVSNVAK